MGALGKAPPTSSSMQVRICQYLTVLHYIVPKDVAPSTSAVYEDRVKVYRLIEGGKWDDQGTGHVTVDYLERSEELGLIVIDEEDNETLLVHHISSNEIYRRQEDTIISWRDQNLSTDLALSFQEPAGCSYIWDQVIGVQRDLQFNALSNERFHGASEIKKLPPVELSTLPVILKTVLDNGVTNQIQVAELILQDKEFFPRLLDLFRMNEDLENMDNLYMISKLVKAIILLNSPHILEKVLGDEFIMDIIGALEYDTDMPEVQPHRAFLKEHVIFKEVIQIKGSTVLSKIHQTYRINYIKDAILPRVLDEGTTASLNSIINSNNATVVSALKDDASFIPELFAKMKSSRTSKESKKILVLFLQEFCSLSKSLALVQQLRLYRELAIEGVFGIITEALLSNDKDLISAGTDILIQSLNQDAGLLRTYVTQQDGLPLLGLLVKGVITDFGENTRCQFLEIIRILLDSYASSSGTQRDAMQRDTIVEIFYDNHLDQLIEVVTSACTSKNKETSSPSPLCGEKAGCHTVKPEILSNICELLCFCVLHHPYRIKCNFLLNNVIEKVLYLTRRREKYLVVAAVRFMRTIISCKDEHIYRHIVKNNLLKPIVDAFVANGNRYNMLHSGVLDILECIRKENNKTLVKYVVDYFWDTFSKFENLEAVHGLKIKYEQALEVYDPKANNGGTESRKHSGERGLEKEEEDYFNEESDEDSATAISTCKPKRGPNPNISNGVENHSSVRTSSGGLVDYDDDNEEDFNPPPRKQETSVEEEIIVRPMSKRKFVSIKDTKAEKMELKKKSKADSHRNDNTDTVGSVNSLDDSHSRSIPPPDISQANPQIVDQGEDKRDDYCCNPSSDVADFRPSNDSLESVNNSASDVSTNNANITGAGPYPVR